MKIVGMVHWTQDDWLLLLLLLLLLLRCCPSTVTPRRRSCSGEGLPQLPRFPCAG
jgi:hypothetical protein